jgi:hypothetical protein
MISIKIITNDYACKDITKVLKHLKYKWANNGLTFSSNAFKDRWFYLDKLYIYPDRKEVWYMEPDEYREGRRIVRYTGDL